MALLVTDQGEIDSLRTLLNSTHSIPRNLVLKLFSSNTDPVEESDVPNQSTAGSGGFWEPFSTTNNSWGSGSGPTTGYPYCINNRTEEDQTYTAQTGILLNGNRWDIKTEASAVTQKDGSGTANTYQLAVNNVTDIKKGDYVVHTGGNIPKNTYVVDIQGTNLELSQQLTANIASSTNNVSFGSGRTTAAYPEQVFTFSGAAGSVYGYYLSRATNLPVTIQGVANSSTFSAAASVEKAGCSGTVGNKYFNLLAVDVDGGNITAGVQNSYSITISQNAGDVVKGQIVTATNVPTQTRVVGVQGSVVYLDKAVTGGAASGNASFAQDVAAEVTVGQYVSKTGGSGQGGPDGFAATTSVVGIDYTKVGTEIGPRVYIDKALTANIGTASSNDKVDFDYSVLTTNPGNTNTVHNLKAGDVVYIAAGTGGAITSGDAHYTVHTTPTTSSFTTTPALQGTATNKATVYPSVFFAERFTNGPYAIQNSGDQIKVTLNVSLD